MGPVRRHVEELASPLEEGEGRLLKRLRVVQVVPKEANELLIFIFEIGSFMQFRKVLEVVCKISQNVCKFLIKFAFSENCREITTKFHQH